MTQTLLLWLKTLYLPTRRLKVFYSAFMATVEKNTFIIIFIRDRGRTSNEMQSPALYNLWESFISSILNILSSKLNQYGEYQNCPLLKCPVAGNFEAGSSEYVITQNCPLYTTKVQCLDFPSATSAFVFLPKKSSDRPQKICVEERR